MKKEELQGLKDWFDMYVQTFKAAGYGGLENIIFKEKHSRRVSKEAVELGRELELNPSDLYLIESIGLLHDVGRFEQFVRYGTFVDAKSVNHAEFGVEILRNGAILDGLATEERDIIFCAILYHSMLALPEGEQENCLFHLKLLRDADKLDIWKVMIDYYSHEEEAPNEAVGLGLPDTEGVSFEILNDLHEGKTIRSSELKNQNDFKLLQIGWVYDINFPCAVKRVLERGYIESVRSFLPENNEIDEIVSEALSRARNRL
jgi:putative nucleotidyltransferase with HDIG domain